MLNVIRVPVGTFQANCYIVSLPERDDCVLIDPGDEADVIREKLSGKRVAAVLLTHGHFDHFAAAEAFVGSDTPLYIHAYEQDALTDPHLNVSERFTTPVTLAHKPLVVTDGITFDQAGIDFTVMHTPGHTQGSVCYLTGGHLFTGDTLFAHGYGTTELPTGDMRALAASLKKLLSMRDECHVHPGHNDETSIIKERGRYD